MVLGQGADRQFMGGLAAIDLAPALDSVVKTLRMDGDEAVQRNAGVALSKIARLERYKESVRAVNGFESLGQIQLKLISKK